MTRPRLSSARHAIRRVRLVGFHNFVDATIEVRDGGHLFLLGDNGSGKTTVLDAIHLVLTGGLDVELNAAVRFGGKREPGRSLAGVVLRHDAERGVVHRAGATAYAALELASPDDDLPITVGVGLEATTMDAQVTKWGFVRRGSFDSLALTVAVPGGVRARTREELRGALGKSEVHLKMTEYRRALADRLFGGEAAYEEVCRFWSMAKSYREIVSGARDFAGLFERLLPGPDQAVLGEIFDSLRRLEELDASIRALELQRVYVAGVSELVRTIAVHREEIARFRWLGLTRSRRELLERVARAREAIALARGAVETATAEAHAAETRREEAERAVREVESADVTLALVRVREGERELAALDRAVESCRAEETGRERSHLEVSERHGQASAALSSCWTRLAEDALHAIEDASRLEVLLPRAMEMARDERRRAGEPSAVLPVLAADATGELGEAAVAARRALGEASAERARRDGELALARTELDAAVAGTAAVNENRTPTALAAARAALQRAGIDAAPLYELLEPEPGASPETIAVLEALLGEELLGALVTSEENVERARAVLAAHRGCRLVVGRRALGVLALPRWIEALFAAPSSPREARARAALAAALSQPAALGEVGPGDALGAIELRGVALLGAARPARLLGEKARRRARAERAEEARTAMAEREASARTALARERSLIETLARLERADASVRALRSAPLFDAQRVVSELARDLEHATLRLDEARRTRAAAEQRRGEREEVLVALRARAAGEGIDVVEARLEALRSALQDARAAAEAGRERRAAGAIELTRCEQAAREAEEASEALGGKLEAAAEDLRRAALRARHEGGGPETDPVASAVESAASLRSLERALDLAIKSEHARCEELAGDGSRGIRALAHAARFGFGLDRQALSVTDRRGVTVESVLAELDLALGESREVVSERTRELLDTLVMGALARELQGQVERLHETVLDLNRLLAGLEFGASQYRFRVVPRPERAELVTLVRRMSVLDPQSRTELRTYLDERRAELARGEGGGGELLDYRRWFDYRLVVKRVEPRAGASDANVTDGETELTREVRALGSGGEQGVPNYLLVLALAKLGYDAASARACPLLFDEAFYGIDLARRDTLLRFATDLGLQLVVASPDQDGVTPAVRSATTLFVTKDENGDVQLAPYHFAATARGRGGQLAMSLDAGPVLVPSP